MSIHLATDPPEIPSTKDGPKNMLFAPARRTPRVQLAGIVVLLAAVCMLLPAAASAHRRVRVLESQVSEEAAGGTLQEPAGSPTSPPTGPETPSEPAGAETSAGGAGTETSTESSGASRRQARRARREARREARAGAGCTIDLQAPRIVSAEASLTLTGTLSCPEAEAVGDQTVTLYQKAAGTPGYVAVGTTSSETNGDFQFPASGLELDSSSFYVRCDGAKSARVRVALAPTVTLSAPAAGTPLFTGAAAHAASADTPSDGAVSFSGTVSPDDAGATVVLEHEFHNGGWDRIGLGHVNQEGGYSILHTFFKAGETSIRIVVRSHGLYMKSASTPVTYLISGRRSSRLTIQASANPLAYGAAVTLSGTVAGAEGQTVTLLAQTSGGSFAPVATAVTVGGGYSFSQSPLQSTNYRVVTAVEHSAPLAETVAYALTPTLSPASVTAGEELTFTGSVTPAHEGQPVELERANLSGLGGYHVIASGTVSAAGTYSIAYTFAAVGNPLLRIRVPGDAEIATATSEPFKLAVTPAA